MNSNVSQALKALPRRVISFIVSQELNYYENGGNQGKLYRNTRNCPKIMAVKRLMKFNIRKTIHSKNHKIWNIALVFWIMSNFETLLVKSRCEFMKFSNC